MFPAAVAAAVYRLERILFANLDQESRSIPSCHRYRLRLRVAVSDADAVAVNPDKTLVVARWGVLDDKRAGSNQRPAAVRQVQSGVPGDNQEVSTQLRAVARPGQSDELDRLVHLGVARFQAEVAPVVLR